MVAGADRRGYLFDSSLVVAALNEEPRVLHLLRGVPSEIIFVPAIALGELYFGALKSRRTEANLERLGRFADASNVLYVDEAVARLYGEARNKLRMIGRPIPENGVWIAATALRYDLTLVTRDSHFEHVEELWLERW